MGLEKCCGNCIYCYTLYDYQKRKGDLAINVNGVLKKASPDTGFNLGSAARDFFDIGGYDYFCIRMEGRYHGIDKRVKFNSSCNLFNPKETAESSGFQKGSRCFLTSSCVEYLHKPDDCEELTKLRHFRDTYITSLPDGQKIIEEYYAIAPSIIEKINTSDYKNNYYEYIYKVIQNCLHFIDSGEPQKALSAYTDMVRKLQSI